jgi:Tol biopolymer transport system component
VLPLSDNGDARGTPRRITNRRALVYGLDWTKDGRSIVFSSLRGSTWGLWRVAVSGRAPEQLAVGSTDAFWPSVSRTGNRLAYSYGTPDTNVWRVAPPGSRAPNDPEAKPVRISRSPQLDRGPTFSPDGKKVAWSSTHSGSEQIWVSNIDGSAPTPLTHLDLPGAAQPLWSPDGRLIAFHDYSCGRAIGVIRAEGGEPDRLTDPNYRAWLWNWSRDSRWVYFDPNHHDGNEIWKTPAEVGSPVQVARDAWGPVESRDGAFLYYIENDGRLQKAPTAGGPPILVAPKASRPVESVDGKFVYYEGPDGRIWKVSANGGEPAPVLEKGKRATWTLSAAGIYLLDPDARGGPALEWFPFTARLKALTRLPGEPDSYTDPGSPVVSPDGRWMLFQHVDRDEADIMLVENFR